MYVSVEATRWVFNHSRSEGSARVVLLAIAAHCNDDGYCWPGQEALMSYANVSKPTLVQAVERLENLEELTVERGGKGPRDTNRYYLKGFMQGERRVNFTASKGKEEPLPRVKTGLHEEESLEEAKAEEAPLPLQEEKKGKDWNKIAEENERIRRANEERKQRKGKGFRQQPIRPAVSSPARVTSKQPESWVWFSATFQRMADKVAYSHSELWPLVEEMLSEIEREEAEERLSIYIDGLDKVTGYAAKDFLGGGWKTIDPEEHRMPRIVNEG